MKSYDTIMRKGVEYMSKVIPECPACGTKLRITSLRCTGCGMELRNDFELSPFDLLNPEQMDFLITFLKQRGNMSSVQSELGISYPTAKKKLEDLLAALNFVEDDPQSLQRVENVGTIDMSNWHVRENSKKASDIIKRKLKESNGWVIVHTMQGFPCEIHAAPDGVSFLSDKLPSNLTWRYEVFDVMVDLLISQGGRAKKGNGRYHRLGEPGCDETTVVGAIGYQYFHAENGKFVYDPVFVLAAILEWADIASNERGELVLTTAYREACNSLYGGDC